jgi:hypothetical protein
VFHARITDGNMKRFIYLIGIIVFFFIISIGIVDSISTLTNDVNTHLWVNIIGRWRSNELRNYEIELFADGRFTEYYYGMAKNSGYFTISGDSIRLQYNSLACSQGNTDGCSIEYKFYIESKALILKTKGSSRSFYRTNNVLP